jgi:hypothetical protein
MRNAAKAARDAINRFGIHIWTPKILIVGDDHFYCVLARPALVQ